MPKNKPLSRFTPARQAAMEVILEFMHKRKNVTDSNTRKLFLEQLNKKIKKLISQGHLKRGQIKAFRDAALGSAAILYEMKKTRENPVLSLPVKPKKNNPVLRFYPKKPK